MKLPLDPPREYSLRDAYDRRVWRSAWAQVARDLFVVGVAGTLAAVAYGEAALIAAGGALAMLALLGHVAATLRANAARARLLREGPQATARMGRTKRVLLLHELFRGDQERTWLLTWRFPLPDGRTQKGQALVCGCVRDRFPEGGEESVAYDPRRPSRSLPLRLAVMVRPWR